MPFLSTERHSSEESAERVNAHSAPVAPLGRPFRSSVDEESARKHLSPGERKHSTSLRNIMEVFSSTVGMAKTNYPRLRYIRDYRSNSTMAKAFLSSGKSMQPPHASIIDQFALAAFDTGTAVTKRSSLAPSIMEVSRVEEKRSSLAPSFVEVSRMTMAVSRMSAAGRESRASASQESTEPSAELKALSPDSLEELSMQRLMAHAVLTTRPSDTPLIYTLISLDGEDELSSGVLLRVACEFEGDDPGMRAAIDRQLAKSVEDTNPLLRPSVPGDVRKLIEADGGRLLWRHVLLHGRGTLGETVLHLCFLGITENRERLIRYLLDRFATSGALQKHSKALVPYVDAEYTAQPYLGEVCLHFACANRSLDMVQRLISAKANVLQPHAGGKFFYSNSHLYYGGSPLNIAACLGDRDVSHPSRLAACRLSAT